MKNILSLLFVLVLSNYIQAQCITWSNWNFTVDNTTCPASVSWGNASLGDDVVTWDFGNGQTSTNHNPPPTNYFTAGTYSVTLTVENFAGTCLDFWTQSVTIANSSPFAEFSSSFTGSCTIPITVQFTNSSTIATAYVWDFGDGTPTSSVANPSHTYTTSGAYTVFLTASNPSYTCTHTDSVIITTADIEQPTFTCPTVKTISENSNCDFVIPDYGLDLNATDNCDLNPIITQVPAVGTIIQSTTLIKMYISDIAGNIDSCEFTAFPIPGEDATFSYANSSYCSNLPDESPNINGNTGGTFTSNPSGLVINSVTGEIDFSISSPNQYQITYTTSGPCPQSFSEIINIYQAPNPYTEIVNTCDNEYLWTIDGVAVTINASGIFTDTLVNSNGCDSVITLDITFNEVDSSVTQVDYALQANQVGGQYQWVNCLNNYSFIGGATGQIFEPTTNGTYALIVTNDGCIDTSSCFEIIGLGINSVTNNFELFPNPTNDFLNINLQNAGSSVTVEISNQMGQLVSRYKFSDSQLVKVLMPEATGIYNIKITPEAGESSFHQVIKQ